MHKQSEALSQIADVLMAVMTIPLNDMEKVIQQAHTFRIYLRSKSPEKFTITRQALRMLWNFRRNIDRIDIYSETAGCK